VLNRFIKGDEYIRVAPDSIRIGYVSGTHGVRGAVRVRLDNPDSALLEEVERLIMARNGECTEYRLASVQWVGRGCFKVQFDGITCGEQAAALHGAIVSVPRNALPPTTEREFYYFETIGCSVVTTTGLPVGIVEEVFSNGANDVWVVRDGSVERLVPVIQDIVKQVDLAGRRIVIEAVPGLLD